MWLSACEIRCNDDSKTQYKLENSAYTTTMKFNQAT